MAFEIDEKKRPLAITFAGLVLVTSITVLILTQCKERPKPDMRPILDVGQVMAEETAKLLGNRGQVAIIALETSLSKAQIQAFEQSLKQKGSVTVTAIENVTAEQMAKTPYGAALAAEEFFKLLEKYPKISAIVSFVGPPLLDDQDIARLDTNIPKVVVFAPMGFGVRKLLEEGVVQVAVVPRSISLPQAPGERESMSQAGSYQVLTPETIAAEPIFEPPPPPVPK